MANLTVTASQVKAGEGALTASATFGQAVTPGQCVFFDPDSQSYKLATAVSPALLVSEVKGIALSTVTATSGGSGTLLTDGLLIIGAGAAPVKGTTYILGATAGSIAPDADAVSTWNKTVIGVGDGNGGILVSINASNQTIA